MVHGPKLTGKLEWTLFEQPGHTVCSMAPVARIITDDGAEIRFDGRGYATRRSPSDPSWRVAATLYFTTGDSRYSWLDGALALWEGEFTEATHHARYTAFLQPAAPAADQRREPRTSPSLIRRRPSRFLMPGGPFDPGVIESFCH